MHATTCHILATPITRVPHPLTLVPLSLQTEHVLERFWPSHSRLHVSAHYQAYMPASAAIHVWISHSLPRCKPWTLTANTPWFSAISLSAPDSFTHTLPLNEAGTPFLQHSTSWHLIRSGRQNADQIMSTRQPLGSAPSPVHVRAYSI